MKGKYFWMGAVSTAAIGISYLLGRAYAAGVPAPATALTYTGTLTDGAGAPLTGTKNVQVILWDAATDGTQQCASASTAIVLQAGTFALTLPATCTTAVHAKPDLWAEVLVDGATLGRTKLCAVPYALEADKAASASGNFAVPGDLSATGNLAISGNAVVTGQLSVGFRVSTTCTFVASSYHDCTCAAGEVAISGGAFGPFLAESRNPISSEPTTNGLVWRLACVNAAGARVACTVPTAVCARLAP